MRVNHYKWLDKYFPAFLNGLGGNFDQCPGIVTAHGDKCYSDKGYWERNNVPFPHGVAIYLLSYLHPWSNETRQVGDKWIDVKQWVVEVYPKYKDRLPPIDSTDPDVCELF